MDAEQQKGDKHHGDAGADGTRLPEYGRQQAATAFDQQRALTVSLMEQVCDPKNLLRAYRRVRSNKGKPGVDGMTVRELADWLRENNEALTASLLDGTCPCVEYRSRSREELTRYADDEINLSWIRLTMRLHQWSTSWVSQWLWIVSFSR